MPAKAETDSTNQVILPRARAASAMALDTALRTRRSERNFREAPVPLTELGELLRAGQGLTHDGSLRSAPSAGALYPLELYVVAGEVEGLAAAVYHYAPAENIVHMVRRGDQRTRLAEAAIDQDWLASAPAVIVIAGVYDRSRGTYGARGERYVHIEAGHAAQNIYLQATALGLGTTLVGAFRDDLVRARLGMRKSETPLALLPVGRV